MKYITTRILKKLRISEVYRRERFDCIFKLEVVECKDIYGNYIQVVFCYNDTELFGKHMKLLGEGYDVYDYESILTYGAKTFKTFDEMNAHTISIKNVKGLTDLIMSNVDITHERIRNLSTRFCKVIEVKTFLNPVALCVVYVEILGVAVKPIKVFLNGKTLIDETEYPKRYRLALKQFVGRLTEEVGDIRWIGENC